MIIKILSSAKNFAGIHYSERKNDLGKSELLKAENFGGLAQQTDLVKSDYINYMKSICALNLRVKNKQFHAVISVKGNDYPIDQLSDIGVNYLEAMGYGKNPYLIYHHSDTDNRHIHLVSTRVDKKGIKVNDAFEKIRSQKVLQEILMHDPKYEADGRIADALSYNFSAKAQFKLLLELNGYHLREKNNGLELIKYGTVQGLAQQVLIDKRIEDFELPVQRAKQLRAIMHKYSVGLSEDKLAALMKEKFGVGLVFHRKAGMERPYGYTVIDHTSKTVFKGSQLMKLGELISAGQDKKMLELVSELATKPGMTFHEVQGELAKLGWILNDKGGIFSGLGKGQLNPELLASLRYAERLQLAATFKINDPSCRNLLGKLLYVNPAELHQLLISDRNLDAHKAVIAYLNQSQRWEEGLQYFNYRLLKNEGKIFLLSPSGPSLIRPDKLLGNSLDIPVHLVQDIQDFREANQESLLRNTSKENLLGLLFDILAESQRNAPENKKNKRKSLKI
jgi:hypothetical protein